MKYTVIKLFVCIILLPELLSGSNFLHISNLSPDSIELNIHSVILNNREQLFHGTISSNSKIQLKLPNLDTSIGELRIRIIKTLGKETQTISKVLLFVNSDASIIINKFDTDSIFLETTKGVSQSSLDFLDIISRLNDVLNSISNCPSVNKSNQKSLLKTMNTCVSNYLNSSVVDFYKLKALEGYVSKDPRKLIGIEDISKQIDNFKLTEWSRFYEYKILKQYLIDYEKKRELMLFDYSMNNTSGSIEKIQWDRNKSKIVVFWSTTCNNNCPPYFDNLKNLFNSLPQSSIYLISSYGNMDEWKKTILDCNIDKWKNYFNSNGNLAPLVIDYNIDNIYNNFLVLDQNNRVKFNSNSYTDFEVYIKTHLDDFTNK